MRRLFEARGEPTEAGANTPILLEDPESAWLVTRGRLNVFAVNVVDGAPSGPRNYLFTAETGGLLLGVEPEWAAEVGLLAVGTVGAEALRLPLSELKAGAGLGSEMRTLVDDYISCFSAAVSDRGQPQADVLLSEAGERELRPGARVSARRDVVWATVREGELCFAAEESLSVRPGDGPFPVAPGAWLVSAGASTLVVQPGAELAENGALWGGLRTFQRVSLEWADRVLEADRVRDRISLDERLEADDRVGRVAMESLTGVIRRKAAAPIDTSAGGLLTACRMVGTILDVDFKAAAAWERGSGAASDELRAIARASGVGYRRVVLSHEWWRKGQWAAARVRAGGGRGRCRGRRNVPAPGGASAAGPLGV